MLLAFFKKGATTTLQLTAKVSAWSQISDLPSVSFTFNIWFCPPTKAASLPSLLYKQTEFLYDLRIESQACLYTAGRRELTQPWGRGGGCPVLLHEWNSQVTFHLLLFFNYIKNTHLCVSCCLGDCEGGWCLTLSSDPSKHHQISASLHSISTRMQTKHFIMVTLELQVSLF